MYFQNYEDYMRSILGYPMQPQNACGTTYADYSNMNEDFAMQLPRYSSEIMDLYPEIYKIVNPMVCKLCEANTKPICKELIEQMTDEIYLNLESDPSQYVGEVVNVEVNLPDTREMQVEKRKTQSNEIKQNNISNTKSVKDSRYDSKNSRISESEHTQNLGNRQIQENRQFGRRNNILRDLIKILILNRLLGGGVRSPRPPHRPRPPFPGGPGHNPRPPRPQFPGGPGFPGNNPRPPFPGGPGMSPSVPSRPPFPGQGPSFPTPSTPSFPR